MCKDHFVGKPQRLWFVWNMEIYLIKLITGLTPSFAGFLCLHLECLLYLSNYVFWNFIQSSATFSIVFLKSVAVLQNPHSVNSTQNTAVGTSTDLEILLGSFVLTTLKGAICNFQKGF